MTTCGSIVTTSGRFRENRRGMIRVDRLADDLAEITITEPPSLDAAATTIRIVVSGDNLDALYRELGKVRSRSHRHLGAVAS